MLFKITSCLNISIISIITFSQIVFKSVTSAVKPPPCIQIDLSSHITSASYISSICVLNKTFFLLILQPVSSSMNGMHNGTANGYPMIPQSSQPVPSARS